MGDRAEFKILGHLEARLIEQPLPLPRPSVQRLLAVLALSPSEPVPASQLTELVFGESGGQAGLQVCVSRLRRWLADEADECAVVERDGSGYVLALSDAEVDARQFAALANGHESDDDARLRDLIIALELWRGPLLADMPERIQLAPQAIRLDRQRVDCACELATMTLANGQPELALPLIEPLAIDLPFDEPLQAAFLRLLGASGRRAVALRRFEQVRQLLADELGVDPAPVLRQAHLDLLQEEAEPILALHQPTVRAMESLPLPVPSELPPDLATFTGRRAELAQLAVVLGAADGPSAVAAISGVGGVGKSALAVHLAHSHAEQFPDGQLYVNLNGATPGLRPLDSSAALGRFLRSLGVSGADVPTALDEASTRYRSLLAGRRMLILLDDAADEEQVRPLIPTSKGCRVIVTSRQVLAMLENAAQVGLGVLSEDEAIALLGQLTGTERVAADLAGAAKVGRLCGYLPLAVRIAGARLTARPRWPIRALAERLANSRGRLDELEYADVGLRASFMLSYQSLDTSTRRAFRLIGLVEMSDFAVRTAAVAAGFSAEAAERAIECLVHAQMVEPHAQGRYRMHDLIRLFAIDRAEVEETEATRLAAVLRTLRFYQATAKQATLILDPSHEFAVRSIATRGDALNFADTGKAAAWLDVEARNLIGACRQAGSAPVGDWELVIGLAAAARRALQLRGYHREAIDLDCLALDAAGHLGARRAQAQARTDLGESYLFARESATGLDHLASAVTAWNELGDHHAEAEALARLGMAQTELRDHDQAAASYERSLEIWSSLDRPDRNTAALIGSGQLAQERGDYAVALRCYSEALEFAREYGKIRTTGIALGNMGEVHRQLGNLDAAVTCLTDALAIVRGIGERTAEAEYLSELSQALYRLGRTETARRCQRQSVEILRQLGKISKPEAAEQVALAPHPPAR